jgi:hypothetical protein
MPKRDLERRPSPLSGPGGRGIDPDVQKTIEDARKRWGKNDERKAYKLTLPVSLKEAIHREAARLTGHKRRGLSDFVTILLEYGWEAYIDGKLEVELQPEVVQRRITRASDEG